MAKGTAAIIFLLLFNTGFAQKTVFTAEEQATLDSILKEDEFFKMMKKALEPGSYFQAAIMLGNSYFSVKNKRINASQQENKLVITPSLAYNHKSGLGIAASCYLTELNGRTTIYQFNVTPSYAISNNKKISAAFSYTRVFGVDKYAKVLSPIKNDIYATAYLKKPWLQPGMAIGFAGGRRTEFHKIDTVLFGIRRVFTDTMETSLRAFSLNASVQHSFEYYELLSKKDGISICPKIMLNAGSNRYKENHYNPFVTFIQRNSKRRKNFGRLQDDTPFELQSFAFNLDINYVIGKFGISPTAYLDYYIPETTDKRFTGIYSVTLGYTF